MKSKKIIQISIGKVARNKSRSILTHVTDISGLRDILSHAYFGVDEEIIWDIIQNKIPQLEEKINGLMEKK